MALTPAYGIGGWMPDQPDENIVAWEETPDPEPMPATLDEQVATLTATVTEQAATVAALLAIIEGT